MLFKQNTFGELLGGCGAEHNVTIIYPYVAPVRVVILLTDVIASVGKVYIVLLLFVQRLNLIVL